MSKRDYKPTPMTPEELEAQQTQRRIDKTQDTRTFQAATQALNISARYFLSTSSGAIILPVDLDIFRPFPSTTKPWERMLLKGALPLVPHDSYKEV